MSDFGTPGSFITTICGIITGTFAAAQFPDVPCSRAKLKARQGNPGSIFIGTETSTVPLPWELDAGQELDWLEIPNLNVLWHNRSSGSSDLLAYIIQR